MTGPPGPGRFETNTMAPTPDEIASLLQVEHLLDQRWPETKIEPSLTRISALMDLLGSPQRGYPSIHVAGTNGKTSVVRMIDALLTALQRRTGRTTSPHLQSAVERIAVDGEPISPARYVATYREIEPFVQMVDAQSQAAGGPAMSKFEVLTAMADGASNKAIAREYGTYNITANLIGPGSIEVVRTPGQEIPGGEGAGIEAIPIPRQGTVDECTATVVFLASEQASYITGQTYLVNGGAYFL